MATSPFYDAGPIKQIAVNLFYGWGYNFYRVENQLRHDDLMIRTKVGFLLGQARDAVETAEADYRREHIKPPTRQNPYPDAKAVENAQALERLSRDIGALEGQIRSQPVPENDFITQRFRLEAPTLDTLLGFDEQLAGQAELLRSMLHGKKAEEMLTSLPAVSEGLSAIGQTLLARQTFLVG